jgi:hypothetical protein
MNCPPSALLGEGIKDETSEFAQEGTEAHALCEYKLKKALGMEAKDPTEGLAHYTQEMEDCATDYVSFVLEKLEQVKQKCPDPVVLIEQKLDFSAFVPDGFGTGDCVIMADGTLEVIDFKYGRGVLVDADNNSQMMLYALGACEVFGPLYVIGDIGMTIFQPRLGNISSSHISGEALYLWANKVLEPAAQKAITGDGELAAGDWCRFCKVKAQCRERARMNMELAQYEFREPPLLDEAEVAQILTKLDGLVAWADDVKGYALGEALKGKRIAGFKLVEGRSIRKYSDEAKVAEKVESAGYDPYERKVKGITAMTGLLGKTRFNELLGALVIKPQGKPALVPESDKRPEMTNNEFNETEE